MWHLLTEPPPPPPPFSPLIDETQDPPVKICADSKEGRFLRRLRRLRRLRQSRRRNCINWRERERRALPYLWYLHVSSTPLFLSFPDSAAASRMTDMQHSRSSQGGPTILINRRWRKIVDAPARGAAAAAALACKKIPGRWGFPPPPQMTPCK